MTNETPCTWFCFSETELSLIWLCVMDMIPDISEVVNQLTVSVVYISHYQMKDIRYVKLFHKSQKATKHNRICILHITHVTMCIYGTSP